MPESAQDKLAKLLAMLAREPADPFLLYGVGMEHKKRSALSEAVEFFKKTIAADQNYCYAYYQLGLTLQSLGQDEAAAGALRDGIVAAKRAGDAHAESELSAALNMI